MHNPSEHIRNFVIIAHVDHGKSTLADRLLEVTGTVEARRMKPQYLDQLDLERERGITIKMAPVRMSYTLSSKSYTLNLIDTPGHSDFSYEVSRALAAVEGAVLLVDVTKGIQAQTLANLRSARKANLMVIGAVNKIDLPLPNVERVVHSLAELLGVPVSDILRISGKTGEGVPELLDAIIERLPPPKTAGKNGHLESLIFDSLYDEHKGVIAFVRVFGGVVRAGDDVKLLAAHTKFRVKETGGFFPELKQVPLLASGEIGYLATGLKESDVIRIGDTVGASGSEAAFPGYREPSPVVFISFYPDGATEFDDLKNGLSKLRLSDPALAVEPEANEALGRGMKVGFLGQLHFEITVSRLTDEFGLSFLTSFPSVAYRVQEKGREYLIKQPRDFPDKPDRVFQPMIRVEILTPPEYVNSIVNLKQTYALEISKTQNVGDQLLLIGRMPLAELIRDFDDQVKSLSAGYASFSYELAEEEVADVVKMEILVAGEEVPALTRVVPKRDVEREGRTTAERLKKLLPGQQFAQAIQAKAEGRIIARETIPALKKDVTGYLYGGDRSRKMKLWKKQQRGKERLKASAKVQVPVEVFREILKK